MARTTRSTDALPLAASIVAGERDARGAVVPVENPAALDAPVGQVCLAGPELAARAMQAAALGAREWARVPPGERGALLAAALDRLEHEELALTLTLENGKTLAESRAEIAGALAEGRWQLAYAERAPFAAEVHTGRADLCAELRLEPVGPTLLITPWNFPLATVVRKLVPALLCGNPVVLKPSELTPFTVLRLVEALFEAGLPTGALQLVLGAGPEVGPALVSHPALRALSFTGSTATGRALERAVAGRGVRFQGELGGKNALVLLDDGELDAAAEAAALAGFACAGQWCTSTSRVIVAAALHEAFVERLVARAAALVVGDGREARTTMGPVITRQARERVERAVEQALAAGAAPAHRHAPELLADLPRGHWVAPTVLVEVAPELPIAREEVFGPVVAVLRAQDDAEALRLADATPYGLSLSVYTRDAERAERFLSAVEAGLCHVDLPTSVRDPALPLGGFRDSGSGPPESGASARAFYTRARAVYRPAPKPR